MGYLSPALSLSLILGALYGALYHLLWGRSARGLFRALLVSIVGFLIGEAGARLLHLDWLMVGDVHPAFASAVAWAGLAMNYWRTH
jgi:uncharacterized membrane protein YeaQ/YmgE (transglycosylase-associated protein family)